MALKGTLKDFGIADIFQLIGHQAKTGTLVLAGAEREVRVGFRDGCVVRADVTTRDRRELLGAMLVRAEVVTAEQLEQAVEAQKRTLKRLGDLLVEARVVDDGQSGHRGQPPAPVEAPAVVGTLEYAIADTAER